MRTLVNVLCSLLILGSYPVYNLFVFFVLWIIFRVRFSVKDVLFFGGFASVVSNKLYYTRDEPHFTCHRSPS